MVPGRPKEWTGLKTVDMVAGHNPDVLHDLNLVPWPFADNQFSEVHGYEILEHLGRQGENIEYTGGIFLFLTVLLGVMAIIPSMLLPSGFMFSGDIAYYASLARAVAEGCGLTEDFVWIFGAVRSSQIPHPMIPFRNPLMAMFCGTAVHAADG